jgi:small subunit ribosomal protein S25e
MAPKEQKSKEAKALAAANSSKGKKKKWSKGKMKEKATYDKLGEILQSQKPLSLQLLLNNKVMRTKVGKL